MDINENNEIVRSEEIKDTEVLNTAETEIIPEAEAIPETKNETANEAEECAESKEEGTEMPELAQPEVKKNAPDNESISIYFYPHTLNSFIKWSRVFAIFMIISFATGMVGVVTIPAGIFGIIACIKLLDTARDLKSRMQTGAPVFSNLAGESFGKSIAALKRYYIWTFIAVAIMIVIMMVLLVVFAEEIGQWLKEWLDEFGAFEDMPDNPFIDDMMTRIKGLLGK